jgi:S1-C subfamily serine protease
MRRSRGRLSAALLAAAVVTAMLGVAPDSGQTDCTIPAGQGSAGRAGCRVEDLDQASLQRMGDALAGRRAVDIVATRGDEKGLDLRALFRSAVWGVPFVISATGSGSGVVLDSRSDGDAWIITNQHVVQQPFRTRQGDAVVILLFYEPQIANQPAEPAKLVGCFDPRQSAAWCATFRDSIRLGTVVATDVGRDLALLRVPEPPARATGLRGADLGAIQPGDTVAAIGHPEGFLWSLTTGIVSAVRSRFRMGDSQGTVIQTQAPVWRGNSGGPLLSSDGRVLGVVSWGLSSTQGFNMAIGINEVQAFAVLPERTGRR